MTVVTARLKGLLKKSGKQISLPVLTDIPIL